MDRGDGQLCGHAVVDRIVHDPVRPQVLECAQVQLTLAGGVLGLVFTGNLATAISIGGFEVITKLVLYFFHERYWARIRWGIIPGSA